MYIWVALRAAKQPVQLEGRTILIFALWQKASEGLVLESVTSYILF